MTSEDRRRWSSVAKALHWSMALLILVMFVLGWLAVTYPLSPTKLKLFMWHKSIGVTLFALVLLRLLWRYYNPSPDFPEDLSRWERIGARCSHILLYGLMILTPLSGYVINSTANFPLRLFGWIKLPNVLPPNETWQQVAERVHLTLFWLFAFVLLLHIAAALRHHFKGDDVLVRMLPGRPR